MAKITIIGDVHGNIGKYHDIVMNNDTTLCVGDFGFQKEWDWHIKNIDGNSHRIVMGNHDYLPYLYKKPSLGDFGMYSGVFLVRGAYSIDRVHRNEGLDWFSNEELPYNHAFMCLDLYTKMRPRVVVSHDCPQSVVTSLFGYPEKSQTRKLLQAMFDEHQPELWVFGHHHKHKDANILGTRFICLEELESLELETDNFIK